MTKLTLNYPNIVDEENQLHSVADPSMYLTFGPWIYLVPQYKPDSVLMLGYGGGSAAKLIHMFYGKDIPITAVDTADVSSFLVDGVTWVRSDAKEYVKTAPKFDTVIVDLFETGYTHPQPFVLSKEFSDDLGSIANYIILHTIHDDDVSMYKYRKIRELSTNSGGETEPRFHYFAVNPIPRLPVR
jgi:hypothetical protein